MCAHLCSVCAHLCSVCASTPIRNVCGCVGATHTHTHTHRPRQRHTHAHAFACAHTHTNTHIQTHTTTYTHTHRPRALAGWEPGRFVSSFGLLGFLTMESRVEMLAPLSDSDASVVSASACVIGLFYCCDRSLLLL